MIQMSEAAKQDWQSPESVNFMEQLAITLHPLSEEKREAFREGYRSGMQDPHANKELMDIIETNLYELRRLSGDFGLNDSRLIDDILNKIREERK